MIGNMTRGDLVSDQEREYKYIGQLPDGYEYKLAICDGVLKIIGIAIDKEPIGFELDAYDKLHKIEIKGA